MLLSFAYLAYARGNQGYATTLTIEPNTTYADVFAADLAAAEAEGAGMWESCR